MVCTKFAIGQRVCNSPRESESISAVSQNSQQPEPGYGLQGGANRCTGDCVFWCAASEFTFNDSGSCFRCEVAQGLRRTLAMPSSSS
jgi:hypothetical protein